MTIIKVEKKKLTYIVGKKCNLLSNLFYISDNVVGIVKRYFNLLEYYFSFDRLNTTFFFVDKLNMFVLPLLKYIKTFTHKC